MSRYTGITENETRERAAFDLWCARVNRALIAEIGLGIDDCPDQDYWCEWEAGTSAERMMRKVIRYMKAGW